MRDSEFFALRAAAAHDEAEAATLDNVRERARRSEAAWAIMAERSARMEVARAAREARPAAMAEASVEA